MSIVILTGAGISAESGLDTFRGQGGLWEGHRIDDVATPEGFERNPRLIQEFYNQRRRTLLSGSVAPNPAHLALARLEREHPDTLIVTQNVDTLHESAGSKNVLHMHGSLLEVRCTRTERVYFPWKTDIEPDTRCPCCERSGTLRPNIVWFGEMPFDLPRIFDALERCTLFLAIGTSGQVYPAAGFIEHVRMKTQARTVELNLEPSSIRHLFQESTLGPASQTVPAFVETYGRTA